MSESIKKCLQVLIELQDLQDLQPLRNAWTWGPKTKNAE